jgi:hypothetical protein
MKTSAYSEDNIARECRDKKKTEALTNIEFNIGKELFRVEKKRIKS